ncbi:3-hydroxyacyl-ACP dehydratase [Streptomyces sp. QH1-20]|uniref:3-hydroxyacyl-ACP dehydratase n=1 Tax=Streptomyces sp. QH1-20 TaxID=3240934 RepID=UPI003511C2E6
MTGSGTTDALGFDGIPLAELCGASDAVSPGGIGGTAVPPERSTPMEPARRMARQVQRAHASVLEAHRAISARQALLAGAGVFPGPRDDPGAWARLGGPFAVLRAAAARLPDATAPGVYEVSWRGQVPAEPTELHARLAGSGAGGPRCLVLDGDRRIVASIVRSAPDQPEPEPTRRHVPEVPAEFRPLARTAVRRLSARGLDALAAGDITGVFGDAFDQGGLEPESLPERWPARLLEDIAVEPGGGPYGQGLLVACAEAARDTSPVWPRLAAAATEALRVHAFHQGLHLCLPGARVVPSVDRPMTIEVLDPAAAHANALRFTVEVTGLGLAPRPYVVADCEVTAAGRTVARLRDIGVTVRERPGADVTPHPGRTGCRRSASGGRAVLDELHLAWMAEGDQAEVFAAYGARPTATPARPRLPRGDLRMLDRCTRTEAGPAPDRAGSRLTAEYDVPADPWYCRESGAAGVPPFALMEMALQPLGLLGGLSGTAWEYPEQDFVCRNLDGRATLLREVDPRAMTVGQDCVLRSSAPLPGAVIERCDFELSLGGAAFCAGEATHGYFTAEVLQAQQGLDGGRYVAPWLERRPGRPAGALRPDPRHGTRVGTGRLALLDDVVVVPGGGDHGAGYVWCDKPVRDDDWFFDRHFAHDPVLPGSVGVQMLFQAVQACAVHTGLVDHLPSPRFALAVGEELRWSYRGQILRHHRRMRGEVHLREVRREHDRLLVLADGSVWRDDLRIHQVDNIALAVRSGAGREAAR